jgi:hypothetical protein
MNSDVCSQWYTYSLFLCTCKLTVKKITKFVTEPMVYLYKYFQNEMNIYWWRERWWQNFLKTGPYKVFWNIMITHNIWNTVGFLEIFGDEQISFCPCPTLTLFTPYLLSTFTLQYNNIKLKISLYGWRNILVSVIWSMGLFSTSMSCEPSFLNGC